VEPQGAVRAFTLADQREVVFRQQAGDPAAPTILLLHGLPTSSHMYRELIPLLAERYHVIAPDLPGFGFSDAADRSQYR
jgi:pimeloyl-ACP methyl ester carboxylesterase